MITERGQGRRGEPRSIKLLHQLMLCCTLIFVADIPGLVLDGCRFAGARAILWVVDSAYWVLQIVYCWLWLLFADYWSAGSAERLKRRAAVYALPMLLELALLAANPFTGWIFDIDGQNVYVRGEYYLLNMLPYAVYVAASLAVTLSGGRSDEEGRRRRLSLAAYMALPSCAMVFDAFVYGISWVWPMTALSLLMVYLNMQQQAFAEERLAAEKAKSELADSRINVMLSQIQPHFLYNALGSIEYLCRHDPEKARETLRDFELFLRGNMESLSQPTPIPFARELEHLRHYLAIELVRFPDKLRVEYDIAAEDFSVPALTLQPIVENAVKHGLTVSAANGGVVRIASRREGSAFVITIEDNGVGFDPAAGVPADGRNHLGLQSVRSRIASICGGSLSIDSAPGQGARVTISIPADEAEREGARGA